MGYCNIKLKYLPCQISMLNNKRFFYQKLNKK